MSLAWVSLIALLIVIVVSCTNRVHPGFLALALAWIIAAFISPFFEGAPLDLKKDVFAGFPVDLFLTLVGVSLLFTQAHLNGTLDKIAQAAVRLCRGNAGLIPWMFFFLTAGLSMSGAGSIASAALMAPTGMAIAARSRISPLLMTILVAHGAIAGTMSPISLTGIIANREMAKIGLPDHALEIFVHNLAANFCAAAGGFVLFGGIPLFARSHLEHEAPAADRRLQPAHWFTLGLIGALLLAALLWKIDVGMGAFACAVVLAFTGLAGDEQAVKKMPWSIILMVCGVNVLTSLLEKTGGSKLSAEFVAAVSTPQTAPALLGFIAGIVSVYSSTAGVVIPAFLPIVRNVVETLSCDPAPLAMSVLVAGNLVDCSPLSTIGALCIAAAPSETETDRKRLFRAVLFWGLAMSLAGAAWCYVFYGLLR